MSKSKSDKKLYEVTLHIEASKQQVQEILDFLLDFALVPTTGGITNVEEIEDDGQEG